MFFFLNNLLVSKLYDEKRKPFFWGGKLVVADFILMIVENNGLNAS